MVRALALPPCCGLCSIPGLEFAVVSAGSRSFSEGFSLGSPAYPAAYLSPQIPNAKFPLGLALMLSKRVLELFGITWINKFIKISISRLGCNTALLFVTQSIGSERATRVTGSSSS